VGKTEVICVAFLCDVACQKLLNSANVSRSYSQNNTGTVFLRHGVYTSNINASHAVRSALSATAAGLVVQYFMLSRPCGYSIA